MAANTPFKHRPLNLNKSQIRLLRLHPPGPDGNISGSIGIHDFNHYPKYYAVSYTWGPLHPTREISLDGQSFTVRENLWQFLSTWPFLSSFHESSDRWLWIDQICIDQSAVDERNQQVGRMAEIYGRADNVCVWLGPAADGSDEAIDAINAGFKTPSDQHAEVKALFERPYWDRLWILQEVLVGTWVVVSCGKKSVNWARLERYFDPVLEHESVSTGYTPYINPVVQSLIREKAAFKDGSQFKNRRLSYVLESFGGLQCEDVRDKVYGLCSLVRRSGRIPVDYSKTPTEVFFNALARVIEDDWSLEPESHFYAGRQIREKMKLAEISDSEMVEFIKEETKAMQIRRISKQWEYIIPEDSKDNEELLADAAMLGDVEEVQRLLDLGTDIESKAKDNLTPLSWTLAFGCEEEEVIKLLVERGANLEARDRNYQTPLSRAAEYGYEATVKLLLETGRVNVDSRDKQGQTPLSWAAARGHRAIVKLLIEIGKADVESEDDHGWTPLIWATKNEHKGVADELEWGKRLKRLETMMEKASVTTQGCNEIN